MKNKILIVTLIAFTLIVSLAWYLSPQSNQPEVIIKTDVETLKKFIHFPGEIKSVVWQTGNMAPNSNDWWLVAIFEIDSSQRKKFLPGLGRQELFHFPTGFDFNSNFEVLGSKDKNGFLIESYSIENFARSPLLNGHAFPLSPQHIGLFLWTM